jgi:hypothetical protein
MTIESILVIEGGDSNNEIFQFDWDDPGKETGFDQISGYFSV